MEIFSEKILFNCGLLIKLSLDFQNEKFLELMTKNIEFFNVLVKIIQNLNKNSEIYILTLECIKNWGDWFENNENLKIFDQTYCKLLKKNVKFPKKYKYFINDYHINIITKIIEKLEKFILIILEKIQQVKSLNDMVFFEEITGENTEKKLINFDFFMKIFLENYYELEKFIKKIFLEDKIMNFKYENDFQEINLKIGEIKKFIEIYKRFIENSINFEIFKKKILKLYNKEDYYSEDSHVKYSLLNFNDFIKKFKEIYRKY